MKINCSFSKRFCIAVLPWIVCSLAAIFYCYEYLLRIMPGLMVADLQRALSVNGVYLDATLIGYLSAFYYYAYTPMQLPVGLLMDRYGPRKILTLAVICCAIGSMLFGATTLWWVAALGRFAIGFGSAFAFVGVLKLASVWLPPNRFAMVTGMTTSLGMIGAMLGGVFLSSLIEQVGWRQTVLYASYLGLILFPLVWLFVRDKPSFVLESPEVKSYVSYRQLWQEIYYAMKNPQIWLNGVIGGLLMMPTMVFPELWGKLYLQTVCHFETSEAASTATIIFLGWAIGAPLAGLLSDWLAKRKLPIMVGSFLAVVLLLVFLYYPALSVNQVKLLLFLVGMVSSVEVICFAIGRENCPASLAATAIAVTNFLVVAFSVFQVIVAKVLDHTWEGVVIDQAKVYSASSYQSAMLILPVSLGLAFVLSFFLKETHCQPMVKGKVESKDDFATV